MELDGLKQNDVYYNCTRMPNTPRNSILQVMLQIIVRRPIF